jgi:hypothetical protein
VRSTQIRLAIAPVIVVAVAFVLWFVSDRLLYVGPFDRATFGWLVVVPLWAAAPTFGGFSWRGFASRARLQSAIAGGLAIGGVAAILLWRSVAAPAVGCTPTHTPFELVLPALAVGAVIGGGFLLACSFASVEIAGGRVGRGLIYGAVTQLLVIPAASLLATLLFVGLCQRP